MHLVLHAVVHHTDSEAICDVCSCRTCTYAEINIIVYRCHFILCHLNAHLLFLQVKGNKDVQTKSTARCGVFGALHLLESEMMRGFIWHKGHFGPKSACHKVGFVGIKTLPL